MNLNYFCDLVLKTLELGTQTYPTLPTKLFILMYRDQREWSVPELRIACKTQNMSVGHIYVALRRLREAEYVKRTSSHHWRLNESLILPDRNTAFREG